MSSSIIPRFQIYKPAILILLRFDAFKINMHLLGKKKEKEAIDMVIGHHKERAINVVASSLVVVCGKALSSSWKDALSC